MPNYFFDTEFLEGKKDKRFLSIKWGETPPTIDLISIGIISENGREYYAISNEFNIEEAWNRYELEFGTIDVHQNRTYWIRDNVLKPIFDWMKEREGRCGIDLEFNFKTFKKLVYLHGQSLDEIRDDIMDFIKEENINTPEFKALPLYKRLAIAQRGYLKPTFWAYYADYDWVVFCWLWGKMIDLPSGFPKYCRDLKQELDRWAIDELDINPQKIIEKHVPQIGTKHSSIEDARWNRQLWQLLKKEGVL